MWPQAYNPPILQTIFHSSAVTGCTDSREYFTSAMSASRRSENLMFRLTYIPFELCA